MATPRQIGRYRVERLLGTGSFATVWLAYDPGLDGRVALKILAENWSLDDDVKRRFLEEARILWRAQNDRIVRVHLVDQHEGRPFFVMDYADRGTLHERIRDRYARKERYSVEEAVAMAREIAACLTVAHDLGIVHRDLKPSNLLFQAAPERRSGAPTERLMLADFGLARRLEATAHQTVIAGTPAYMAPEQGDERLAGRVDERSDVFSANAILYELLAGAPPFTGRSIDSVRDAQRLEQVKPLTTVRGDIPGALDAVIRRGLAYDPAARHATAHDWSEALTAALGAESTVATANEPTVADPPPAASPPAPAPAPRPPKAEPRPDPAPPQPPAPDTRVDPSPPPAKTRLDGEPSMLPEPSEASRAVPAHETHVEGPSTIVPADHVEPAPPLAPEPDIETGGATSVPLPPGATSEASARRSPPLTVIVAGIAAVVLIAVVLAFVLQGGGGGGGDDDTNKDPKRAALTTAPAASSVTCPSPATATPDGGLALAWLAPDRPGLPGTVRVNPAQSFEDVVVATDEGVVAGFEPNTGAETFREQLDGPVRGNPGQSDSVLYYTTTAGSLYRVDPSAAPGAEVTRVYKTDRPLGGVAIDAGVAYIGRTSVDGGLLMVDLVTGKKLRVIPTDGAVFGKPNVDEKVTRATYFASAGGTVYRLALPGTGAEQPMTFRVGGRVEAAVGVANDRIVVATTNGIVAAHDAASGAKIWSQQLEQGTASSQPGVFVGPALTGELAVVAASDCGLHALDLQQGGETVWTVRSDQPIETPPVAAAGGLIMTNAAGCVSAVKAVPDAGRKDGQILAVTKPCPEAVPQALYANKNWARVGTDAGQVLAVPFPAAGFGS